MNLSFRFNALWITLGGLIISLGSGIYAFDAKFRVAALIVFLVGVVCALNGLLSFSSKKTVIHLKWDARRIMRALKKAPITATVQILQTWFPEEDFIADMEHLYVHDGKRFHLRVMLMAPDLQGETDVLAARVKMRWIERDIAVRCILQTRDGLVRLKRHVDARLHDLAQKDGRSETPYLQIRWYDFMPFGPIYKIGDDVAIGLGA